MICEEDFAEMQKILALYNQTSTTMEGIQDRIIKCNVMTETDELSLHYHSFKNMNNFLATQTHRKVVSVSLGYDGMIMLRPSEISSRDKKYNEWQKNEFDDHVKKPLEDTLSRPDIGIDIGIFENVLDWAKIAEVKDEDPEEIKAARKTLEKIKDQPTTTKIRDVILKDFSESQMKEVLDDTEKTTFRSFATSWEMHNFREEAESKKEEVEDSVDNITPPPEDVEEEPIEEGKAHETQPA